ncbi:hypothetical protein D5F01_LYC05577 [Larimichthys crocea]|uniref:Uncharacterized protein n=1 Tax=Larimichthys crocea TaxID=215358 RepID=A0A6G0IZT9_LARCR|nr:hypothetical protein D5F01_LYC05577 [Larimichthys crocea]
MKLILPSGIPDSVDNLKFEIQKHCGIEGEFRLQYMDNDFDQFMNLTSTADIQDKGTVKVIIPSEQSTQYDSIETRRACSLQALALYLNEDPEELVKEYGSKNPDETRRDLDETIIGIYVIKHPGADVDQLPEDVGIIVEGVEVLHGLRDVATACA